MAGTLQVYSYNRCSTCRKALAWLTERGIAHEVHDITLTPPSKDMLVAAHQSLGDRKLLFNTSGQSYRACLLYTSPSPRDATLSRMPSSA